MTYQAGRRSGSGPFGPVLMPEMPDRVQDVVGKLNIPAHDTAARYCDVVWYSMSYSDTVWLSFLSGALQRKCTNYFKRWLLSTYMYLSSENILFFNAVNHITLIRQRTFYLSYTHF